MPPRAIALAAQIALTIAGALTLTACGESHRPDRSRIVHLVVDERFSQTPAGGGFGISFRWPSPYAGYAHVREWVGRTQREEDWVTTDGRQVHWRKLAPDGRVVTAAAFRDPEPLAAADAVTAMRAALRRGAFRRRGSVGGHDRWVRATDTTRETWLVDGATRMPVRYVRTERGTGADSASRVRYDVRFRVAEILPYDPALLRDRDRRR